MGQRKTIAWKSQIVGEIARKTIPLSEDIEVFRKEQNKLMRLTVPELEKKRRKLLGFDK